MATDTWPLVPGGPTHPRLAGRRLTLRPGRPDDAVRLHEILAEPSVASWWGQPDCVESIAADLRGGGDAHLLVIETNGSVAGGIQYDEENEPNYRHASIDIFLAAAAQGRGLGGEAMALLVRFLIDERHHHRLIIDPAASNARAIRCYTRIGFHPVGLMRQYERGPDGRWHDGLLMDLLAADAVPPAGGPQGAGAG